MNEKPVSYIIEELLKKLDQEFQDFALGFVTMLELGHEMRIENDMEYAVERARKTRVVRTWLNEMFDFYCKLEGRELPNPQKLRSSDILCRCASCQRQKRQLEAEEAAERERSGMKEESNEETGSET